MDLYQSLLPVQITAWKAFAWILPLVLLVWALQAFHPRLRGLLGERRVSKVLRGLFPAVLDDVVLPDGRGGWTQIDHIALTPAGFLVVESKNYRGLVLGTAKEPTWTQVLGRQRRAFQNPLRQNYAHLKAIESLALGVPVIGRVVFTNSAQFPKGVPEGVSRLSTLAADLASERAASVAPLLDDAWQRLKSHVRTDHAARRAHRDDLARRFGPERRPTSGIRVVIAAGLLAVAAWLGRFLEHPLTGDASGSQPRLSSSFDAPSQLPDPSRPPRPRVDSVPAVSPPADTGRAADVEGAAQVSIRWVSENGGTTESEDCRLARTAVLIANTPENRSRRARACPESTPAGVVSSSSR